MKCWNHGLWLVISVNICFHCRAKNSSADSLKMTITNTSHDINVTWEQPDESKFRLCYKSHLQYRSHCESSWKSVENIEGFSFVLLAPDMKKNYVFRVKTSLACIRGNWSKWSPEKYWKNDTILCIAETSLRIKGYLLVTLLPLLAFLLLFAITRERVRRFILPIIPDPKHTQDDILNMEQFEWFISITEASEECKIVEAEVIYQSEEEKTEISDEPSPQKPTDAVPGSHDLDLTANTNTTFCIYSPDTVEDNRAPQCSHMPGYIVL